MFGCTWDHFATARNSVQNGPNWCNKCKSSCHEVVSELFATNASDPQHWTLNSCFVAFRKVWVHLGSFRYCTKTQCKMGRTGLINAKVHATKSRRNFLLRTHPIHTHGALNSCFVSFFVMFGCIWDRFVTALNSVQMGQSGAINA